MQKKSLIAAFGTLLLIIVITTFSRQEQPRQEAPTAVTMPAGQSLPKVELYTTSWCPACREAVRFLKENNVPFTEYDIEKDPEADARFRALNLSGSIPLAVIGDQQILGFDPQAYAQALGLH